MPPSSTNRQRVEAVDTPRRRPVQRRSRERVERILLAAERLVVEHGVDALTTSAVASAAEVPVASLYQYFADREAIITALIERHVRAMDDQLAAEIARLTVFSVRSLVETTVAAYVAGYRQRPSYVILWFQGRVTAELSSLVLQRTADLGERFRVFAVAAGLTDPGTDPLVFTLAGEMIDAFLGFAYREDVGGDPRIIAEGIEMLVSYLERHATPLGIAGLPATELAVRLEVGTTP